jgi:hypothetical protein
VRRPLRAAALSIACAIVVGVCVGVARAQDARDVHGAAKKVLDDGGFQTWLPGDGDQPASPSSDASQSRSATPRGDSPYESKPNYDASSATWYVGWGLAIVGAAIALVWILQEVRVSRSRGPALPAAAAAATSPRPAASATTHAGTATSAPSVDRGALARARALADAGRREEAVHELLLAAITALAGFGRAPTDAALTSRELVDVSRLVDDHRAALRVLVGAVEASRFGGRAVDVDGFERCTSAFASLERAGSAR